MFTFDTLIPPVGDQVSLALPSIGWFIPALTWKVGIWGLPLSLGVACAWPVSDLWGFGGQIFLLDNKDLGRSTAEINSWKEDMQWARRLDYGWDLNKVKQVRHFTFS